MARERLGRDGLSSPSLFTALINHTYVYVLVQYPFNWQLMSGCAASNFLYGDLQQESYYTPSGLSHLL